MFSQVWVMWSLPLLQLHLTEPSPSYAALATATSSDFSYTLYPFLHYGVCLYLGQSTFHFFSPTNPSQVFLNSLLFYYNTQYMHSCIYSFRIYLSFQNASSARERSMIILGSILFLVSKIVSGTQQVFNRSQLNKLRNFI